MVISDEERRARDAARKRATRSADVDAYNAAQRAWKAANKEKVAIYRAERREKDRAKTRAWRRNNPEKVREYKRLDYHRHKEKHQKRNRAYVEKNKDRLRAQSAEYYRNNADEIRAKTAKWRRENPEHVKARAEAHRLKNRGSYLFYGISKKCRNDGLALDITPEWINERLSAGVCEMSGLPFDMVGKRMPNSPSIDRRDPKGGYTMDNCRVILWFLNRAMSNLGEDYALMVFAKVLERRTVQ